ncbi:MAG TPA: L-2-hydroxyglutarate oxidase [Syntrophobacteraceae bacterium]|nr:L-2-hydroxyglutarate oxidase [Syntrophobacteraceae bacterium]
MKHSFDVVIIGAGIVGLATAMKLVAHHRKLKVAVVEKESGPARHQTGHNSGVIHSGLYYRPGSLKARTCVDGARQLREFCLDHKVPFEMCGKVVVATEPDEIPRLHELHRRGQANGVTGLRWLTSEELREIEPNAAGMAALQVASTGIIDFTQVARAYARVFQQHGGTLLFNYRVRAVTRTTTEIHLLTSRGPVRAGGMINCGGLYSDSLARLAGLSPPCRIVPFRGEYYALKATSAHLVNHLIYPVPDPRFPFLGVHFTRLLDGRREAGPNAVLAWAREGYHKTTINPAELTETLTYPGFWRLARRYWQAGLQEMVRSHSKARFVAALQRLVPIITTDDLEPGGAGVRAQALDADGRLVDDFVLLTSDRSVHVLNAPSPAATSSLAIADHILDSAMSTGLL